MFRRLAGIVGVILVVAIATVVVAGQTRSAPSYVPPRTADGHPDLQGIWRAWNLARYDLEPHAASYGVPAGPGVVVDPPDGLIPYKPWALARKKENFARSRITFPYDPLQNPDPLAKCYIPGVPRITYLSWPFEIVQAKDFVALVYEWMHLRRMIPLGNRPVPEGLEFWVQSTLSNPGDDLMEYVCQENNQDGIAGGFTPGSAR